MKKIMFNDQYGLTEAVLKEKKSMTRRLIKDEKLADAISQFGIDRISLVKEISLIDMDVVFGIRVDDEKMYIDCIRPKYKVGEVVAVAQKYQDVFDGSNCINPFDYDDETPTQSGWNNKMFVKSKLMPHKIKITGIRTERLQDISNEDCLKEGIEIGKCGNETSGFMTAYYMPNDIQPFCKPTEAFSELIDKVSGNGTWNKNTFVWIYEFKLVD